MFAANFYGLKTWKAVLIVLVIVVADQALKIWVKTHMVLEQEIVITHWFRIHFAENRGMAFSMELPGIWGKNLLSFIRVVAVIFGIWFIRREQKRKAHAG